MRTTGGEDHFCADSRRIGARAAQRHREIVMTGTVQVAHPIAVDRSGRVEIVHHQIERAVVVEIHVRGAVRESRSAESPGGGQVGERQIAVVMERVIRLRNVRHLRNESRDRRLDAGVYRVQRRDVVEIVRPPVDACRDEQVFLAVVVEIREQRRPAPVRRRDPREEADVTEPESPVQHPAIQLEGVARILIVITRRSVPIEQLVVLRRLGTLQDALAVGKHIDDGDIGPAVVVEVGRIRAHREAARMPRRLRDRLRERAVAVVEIQEIVFREIVGDVDVGTTVEIHVADDDPQSKTFHTAVDMRGGADVYEVAVVIAIEPVTGLRVANRAARAWAGGAL